MKILVITALWPRPGNPAFGSFVRTQVEALKRAGLEVEVLVLEGRIRKLIYLKAPFQLRRRLVADPSIDLVHAHYGLVGIVARTQFRVPLVVTYHGDDVLGTVDTRGRTSKFSLVLATVCRGIGSMADAVIVQTEQMAARFGNVTVHVVPHEINFDVFDPIPRDEARAALGLDAQKKYLLFAANPEWPVKRFPLAAAATERLRRHDPNVELLVVCRESQPRLALYMSACDALVFPSFQEGSPNVVKQAMACNLPIVATDVGDVRQVLGTTPHCYICEPEISSFAERLSEILHYQPRTDGRQRVCHLGSSLVAPKIINIYQQTLSKHSFGAGRMSRSTS